MGRIQIRTEREDAWSEAAEKDGVSLSEFVRKAVEDRISGRTTKAIARAVANELLPELERMLQGPLPQFPRAPEPEWQPARPFSRQCENAEIHQVGLVCPICGGSV